MVEKLEIRLPLWFASLVGTGSFFLVFTVVCLPPSATSLLLPALARFTNLVSEVFAHSRCIAFLSLRVGVDASLAYYPYSLKSIITLNLIISLSF